jgi:ABC-type dipeptide/oligopeptide/nickel transport system permease component
MAIGIEFTLAIIIGTISALRKGKFFDHIALIVALVAIAIPIFVVAFLAQYFLAIKLGLVQTDGRRRQRLGRLCGCRPSFSDSACSR